MHLAWEPRERRKVGLSAQLGTHGAEHGGGVHSEHCRRQAPVTPLVFPADSGPSFPPPPASSWQRKRPGRGQLRGEDQEDQARPRVGLGSSKRLYARPLVRLLRAPQDPW